MYRSRRIAACVLARTGSRRLPGKTLLPFLDGTVLSSVIERLRCCHHIDEIVLATTRHPTDDEIANLGRELGVQVFRGDEDDVVGRMTRALDLSREEPDVLVRACADNHLVMPSGGDEAICELVDEDADLVTPFEYATYPFGFGLVAMTRSCLERIDELSSHPLHREHVENYCFEHPGDFRILHQLSVHELQLPELSLTLDHPVDYERLCSYASLLKDVPLPMQPQVLVRHARSGRVWIEGRHEYGPEGHDLVLLANEREVKAPRGVVVVDVFDLEGSEHYGLRYARGTPWHTGKALFIDDGPSTGRESPAEFLSRTADLCVPKLLAGPIAALPEPYGTDGSKSVEPTGRGGFHHAYEALFPSEVVLGRAEELSGTALLESLLSELERHPRSRLIIAPEAHAAAPTLAELAIERLGEERVEHADARSGDKPVDPFRRVVVDASGHVSLGDAFCLQDLGEVSIEGFWRSPSARRLRVENLNAESLA